VYLSKIKNFKDEKETTAIAKTPGHRKKRNVIESLPLIKLQNLLLLKEKVNYYETIHDGTIGIKETI